MATTFDLSDVPAADASDLATAMRTFIENGRGLILVNGASDADLDTACTVFQDRHHSDPRAALVAFVRLRHLIEVFGARRLQQMLLDNGHALIAPAIAVASQLRLNAHRGFNPQRFLTALREALGDNVSAIGSWRRMPMTLAEACLAA